MKNFVVLGLGRFGSAIATTLYDLGYEVLAIDKDEEVVQLISDKVTHAVATDVLDEKVLKSMGVRNFDTAIVAMGEDMQSSILATVLLKDIGINHVVAKAQSDLHASVLEKVGADKVVFPERDMAVRVANNLAVTNILDYIELSPKYSIIETTVPKQWVGKTLLALNVRAKAGANVIAIKRGSDENINISPSPDDVFEKDDVIVVVGPNGQINNLDKIKW